ncbi:MAG: DUF5667 domain-containing protein [Chloroflexota bacterium]
MNNKEEILARCIDEVLSGQSTVEDCLARYPELREELKPLLEVAISIQVPKVAASPEFRQRTRDRLLEIMESAQVPERRQERIRSGWLIPALSLRAVAIVLLAFAIIVGGSTSVYASQNSLPGDVLYPVKTGVEKLQVAVTVNPESKAYLHLKSAQRRIDEVAVQASLNRTVNTSGLATVPAQTDAALREIEKASPEDTKEFLSHLAESTINQQVTLGQVLTESPEADREAVQQTITVAQRTNLIAQAGYSNESFLKTNPSVRDARLEEGRFKVDGALLSVSEQTWNVGGVVLSNVHYSGEPPPIGSRVKVQGLKKDNEIFIINLDREEATNQDVKIEGQFKGTDESGKTWYVGEIPVGVPTDKTPPPAGDKVALQGVTENGTLAITNTEQKERDREREGEAKLEGRLTEVNTNDNIITVSVAGARINLNISEAKIRTEDGEEIQLSELRSSLGEDLEAEGLFKKDGILYAKEIRIEQENRSSRNSHNSGERD